jgi:GT2 family glycosyltransferase
MLRAYDDGADYFLVLDPDIVIRTDGWLVKMTRTVSQIKETGVAGIYCGVFELHPLRNVEGVMVHEGNPYGPKMWTRALIDEIGWLCEEYGIYGNEDCDWIHRCIRTGKVSYYVPEIEAAHEGNDTGSQDEYRQMKWTALRVADDRFQKKRLWYDDTKQFYIQPPPLLVT